MNYFGEYSELKRLNEVGNQIRAFENVNILETTEVSQRELTPIEKAYIKEKTKWSDDLIKKCTIDENQVIYLRTDRCDLEGKIHETSNVPYARRIIDIEGIKVSGVFPVFDSPYEVFFKTDVCKSTNYANLCNAKLKETITKDPELRKKFTPEQIRDIEKGNTPDGYVWHHNEEKGRIQLVSRKDHDRTIGGAPHTGGSVLWGPDTVTRNVRGEKF